MADQEECRSDISLILASVLITSLGSTNANEALEISFVHAAPGSPRILSSFHPQFTYPIFGDEERIFGYQNLKLNLRFAAHDLRPNLEVLYDRKFKAVGDTKATDIEETLREWTPEGAKTLATSKRESRLMLCGRYL